jgi:hypothetical protein
MENIGIVRRGLFISEPHEWNGIVRDITAQLERPGELVDAEKVCIFLADHYRQKAHWERFAMMLREGCPCD